MRTRLSTIVISLAVVGLAAGLGLRGMTEPAAAADGEESLTLRVEGMFNAGCAMQVRHTLEGLEGVASATVDREAASAQVSYEADQVDPEAIVAAVNAAGYRASVQDCCDTASPSAGARAAAAERLASEEIDRVAAFVAERLLKRGEPPAEEAIHSATGLTVSAADLPAVQAAVVTRLVADPQGRELLAGSRCSEYGACSLWRNLATATGDELARYEADRARDGELMHGVALPEFAAVDLEGRTVRSRSLSGHPALVTLLAVHCTHSMETFPVLDSLHRRFAEQGLEVRGVLVNSGSAEDAREWVPQFEPTFPVWVHEDASLGDEVGSRLVPTYLLVDAEGELRQVLVGFKSEAQVAAALESALGPATQ